MDASTRQLHRQAATGDLDAEARALRARVRAFPEGWASAEEDCPGPECQDGMAGKWTSVSFGFNPPCCHGAGKIPWPVQSRLELAAWCGSAAVRLLGTGREWMPWGIFPNTFDYVLPTFTELDALPLERWLPGLSRWPHVVSVRAACAAAEVAHGELFGGCSGCKSGRVVSSRHMTGCMHSSNAIKAARHWCETQTKEAREAWDLALDPWRDAGHPAARDAWVPWTGDTPEQVTTQILAAARLTSEEAVRAAICTELINYSLGET